LKARNAGFAPFLWQFAIIQVKFTSGSRVSAAFSHHWLKTELLPEKTGLHLAERNC
jgi:hypothetical protein